MDKVNSVKLISKLQR